MKRYMSIVAAVASLAFCWPAGLPGQQIEVYFSPNGGATPAAIGAIDAATKSIEITAYSISDDTITTAIIRAKNRNVKVELVVDPSQESHGYSSASKIAGAGIETKTDHGHALMHDKYIVIDDQIVVTGSHNWTIDAEKHNAENMLVIHDEKTAKKYRADFDLHWSHSTTFRAKPRAFSNPKPAHVERK